MKSVLIGQVLLNKGYINEEQLQRALDEQKKSPGKRLADVLLEQGVISERQYANTISEQLDVPFTELPFYSINIAAVRLVSENIAKKYTVIPIDYKGNVLTVATNDPLDLYCIEEIEIRTGMQVVLNIAMKSVIRRAIERFYSETHATDAASNLDREFAEISIAEIKQEISDMGERVDSAPIVKLASSILIQSYNREASDIHIEPSETMTRVRIRVDGDLLELMNFSSAVHNTLITRYKIMSNMNIAERRQPQDGNFRIEYEKSNIDFRVSTLPTVYGEKMVIRILSTDSAEVRSLKELGVSDHNQRMFDKLIKYPYGIILVTGPTGSGKTTTLYSVLQELNQQNVNIITIEDPVEKSLEGVNQVPVNVKAGLTFASALRSILRQDPDIIMVGEIRDGETAEIATRAAITGHLVLSSLHTNDAVSSITRLVDMGIESYLVASSVVGVLAQRLVKLICPHCRVAYTPSETERQLIGSEDIQQVYKGEGCEFCSNTGYKGRTAIHEIILVDATLRDMITKNTPIDVIRDYAVGHGTKLLRSNLVEMIREGKTTVEQLLRIDFNVG